MVKMQFILGLAPGRVNPDARRFIYHLSEDPATTYGGLKPKQDLISILDHDLLKDYSWSLAKLVRYWRLTLNVVDLTKFDATAAAKFELVKKPLSAYIEELGKLLVGFNPTYLRLESHYIPSNVVMTTSMP